MSVVDWSEFPEQFRGIGRKFSEMLPALIRGDPVQQPHDAAARPRPQTPVAWKWIIERRIEMGLSQRELARRAGCHQSDISKSERGERRPSPAMRKRLAAILLPESQP
jgi:DNA-binding transcriptional regulator YiaG